jgi:hypothetical protein
MQVNLLPSLVHLALGSVMKNELPAEQRHLMLMADLKHKAFIAPAHSG